MRVVAKVGEPMVDRIHPGDRVRIKVDAFLNETLSGTVEDVAPRPDVSRTPGKGPKLYTTRLAIEGGAVGCSPPGRGMTAGVEILVLELDNVLAVPVASVVRYGDKDHVAVKLAEGAIDWREVTLGETNSEVVEVKGGLKAGEAVVLNPVALMTEEEKRQKFGSPIRPTPPAATPR